MSWLLPLQKKLICIQPDNSTLWKMSYNEIYRLKDYLIELGCINIYLFGELNKAITIYGDIGRIDISDVLNSIQPSPPKKTYVCHTHPGGMAIPSYDDIFSTVTSIATVTLITMKECYVRRRLDKIRMLCIDWSTVDIDESLILFDKVFDELNNYVNELKKTWRKLYGNEGYKIFNIDNVEFEIDNDEIATRIEEKFKNILDKYNIKTELIEEKCL